VHLRPSAALLFLLPLNAAINFEEQIVPILVKHCRACHNPQKAEGALRITTRVGSMKAIVPNAPEKSPLWLRMEIPAGKPGAMPPDGQLSQQQRDLVRDWIKEGANWPNGIILEGMKLPSEERETVARFHAKIVATTKEKTPAEMKQYKSTIPGTSATFEMVPIPAGEFTMGTPDSEKNHRKDESPQHKVRIDAFWMAKFEVTWDEYRPFMFHRDEGVDAVSRPTRPYVEMSFGMGLEGFPAISMTQHAANKYAEWLSAKTGHFYRLPTEAEWEYACRAGATTAYSYGDDPAQLGDYAWFATNSNGKYQKVGTKKPNAWGLFDMSGNVMEWTLDQYSLDFYGKSPLDNPWNKATKAYPHAVRGGSWSDPPDMLRCGARVQSDPDWKMQDPQMPKSPWYETDAQWLGFRLVRPLKVPSAEEMYKYWNSGVERHVY
jgi:formylglycine-generating enzyme required for sulfatase activity